MPTVTIAAGPGAVPVTVHDSESVARPFSPVAVTVKVPARVNVWVTDVPVPVPPSPKFQVTVPPGFTAPPHTMSETVSVT